MAAHSSTLVALLLVAMVTYAESSSHYILVEGSCEYRGRTYRNGEEVEVEGCNFCQCTDDGLGYAAISCVRPYCPPPRCHDSLPSSDPKCPNCGRICPNGANCKARNGQTVPLGSEIRLGQLRCRCQEHPWNPSVVQLKCGV